MIRAHDEPGMISKVLGCVNIVVWRTYFIKSVKLVARGVVQRLKALLSYQTLPRREALESYIS